MKSNYQIFKLWLLASLPLAKDAIHIYIGFFCFLLALIVLRRRLSSYTPLISGLVVAIAMEILDLRDGYAWLESAKDIVNTNLIPFLFITLARMETFNI
jgi:F420-0:gamma-glutamyl ligase-like protein